jgi:hypothetical protein
MVKVLCNEPLKPYAGAMPMNTECKEQALFFQAHGTRTVRAAFAGGQITSDGGALLLGRTRKSAAARQ